MRICTLIVLLSVVAVAPYTEAQTYVGGSYNAEAKTAGALVVARSDSSYGVYLLGRYEFITAGWPQYKAAGGVTFKVIGGY